ncbi:sugar-binding transcriptional regulator [Caldisericum sp.]|uniref:sugar-binding transcriptional regulator n=1 Tax=Caldisericum sp. TaxID=2499687 RepID=UPI003C974B7A
MRKSKYSQYDVERVVWLVYKREMLQSEVSKELGIPRPVISRMLKHAREKGMIETKVNLGDDANLFEIASDLKREFDLKEAIIAPTGSTDEDIKEKIAIKAADYLTRIFLKRSDFRNVGVPWGTTLYKVIYYLPSEMGDGGIVVPLVGGVGGKAAEFHSNNIARELAKKLSAEWFPLYAPAILRNNLVKGFLYNEFIIQDVFEKMRKVKIAIVGIGSINPNSTMLKAGYFKPDEFLEFGKEGIVGDVCSYFFNINGNVSFDINKNVVGINSEDLKKIPLVVGIAGG